MVQLFRARFNPREPNEIIKINEVPIKNVTQISEKKSL